MAKGFIDIDSKCRELVEAARKGEFHQVYLLMGDEPYYVDMVCDAVVEHALDEADRDFNETIFYGADVTADDVIAAARRYPMFAERQLVVVKEAQMMSNIEALSYYCDAPLDSTILVIAMHSDKVDKRKAFYKSATKAGVVVETQKIRDYEMSQWITMFFKSKGISIDYDAAALLGEYAGNDLNKIAIETEKMFKNLPEGTSKVSIADIEKNVGISRQYSIFELTKELSYKNAAKALKIAAYYGSAAKFALPAATAPLYLHFLRILKYNALLLKNPRPASEEKVAVLGVPPFFHKEYDAAIKNYPLKTCMKVIAILKEYDFKGKGGNVGEATDAELLVELVTLILNA